MKKTISMNVTRVHVDVCDEINIKLQCVDLRGHGNEHEKREYIFCRALVEPTVNKKHGR